MNHGSLRWRETVEALRKIHLPPFSTATTWIAVETQISNRDMDSSIIIKIVKIAKIVLPKLSHCINRMSVLFSNPPLRSIEDSVEETTTKYSVRAAQGKIQKNTDTQCSLVSHLNSSRRSSITSGIAKTNSSPVPSSSDCFTSAPAYTFFKA